jgi:amino acid transporter
MLGIVAIATAGHLATTYIVAFIALFFTATSYAKMANRHPIAGSAYSYSQRAIHPFIGFVIGWALFMSYMLVPLLSVLAARDLCFEIAPAIPAWFWIVAFVVFMTVVNLFGIQVTATANTIMTAAMIIAAILFVVIGIIALANGAGEGVLLSTKPLYNPETFNSSMILTGASIAVFSFLGFDGVSTLAEEVENPRVNIGRATILVAVCCLVIFVTMAYISQLVYPDYSTLNNDVSDALLISRAIGGEWFYYFIFIIMIVAGISCALASLTSAARLMYGMGRDGVLPRKFFSYVSPKSQIPTYNILLIAAVTLILAFTFKRFQTAAEVLNYGAFLGFFSVNAAVIFEYLIRNRKGSIGLVEIWKYLIMPLCGMYVIYRIFRSLNPDVLKWVTVWIVLGIIWYAIITRGFRKSVEMKIEE